jgi:molybdenum cofactor cytidylyltransferase
VLAAGLSSRMAGAHKLVLDIAGEPMLRRVVRAVLGLRPAEVVVVTGYRAPEIAAGLAGLPVRFAHNARFEDGQPGSVVTGVRALTAVCDAVMIVLGDQPLLTQAALSRLMEGYDALPPGKSILVPLHGNPVLFAARHIPAIAEGALKLGRGGLLDRYPDIAGAIEMADDAFTRDCDTPADYAALQARITG